MQATLFRFLDRSHAAHLGKAGVARRMCVVSIEMSVVRGEVWRLEAAHNLHVEMEGWGCNWNGG